MRGLAPAVIAALVGGCEPVREGGDDGAQDGGGGPGPSPSSDAEGGAADTDAPAGPDADGGGAPPRDGGERPQCGAGAREEVCPRGVCLNGRCVEPAICERVRDCLGDRVCVDHTCRDACFTHGDCPGAEECTDGLCGPPPPPECGEGRACLGRRTCHSTLAVCVEPAVCLDDSDCDITRFGPRRCDPEAGTCAYCRTDDDCRASRRCAHDPFAGEPICTEPERCTDHADCLPGRRCIPSTGSCVFDDVCIDDAREPNDDPAQADDNERSHLAEARYTGLSLCGTSPDWYRVRVPPGRGLAVTMRHLVPFDDLNLDVFAADTPEAPVARGSGAQNAKRAAVPGYLPGGGFSYVRVTSLRGGSNFYSLELDLPECVDDAREEDDTAAAARRVEEALPGWLCGPDQDWAWLEAPAGATVVADLVHPAGGRALTLRHTTTPERTGSGRNGRDVAGGVTLRAPTGTGGSQWLAVSAEGGVRAPYHLEVSLVSGDCPDDEREENDGRLTPARLEPGSNRSLRACPSDPDWYAIPLLAGDGVEVRAFSEPRGVLDAALLPPVAGAEPPEVVARPDPEGVVRLGRAPQSGDWLLRVTSPVAADYRLDLVEVAGGYCVNDP